MLQPFEARNATDQDGMPAGGSVRAPLRKYDEDGDECYRRAFVEITWQDGPLGRGGARREPSGAFVETVIAAARQRIQFYQEAKGGRFACKENAQAIAHLDAALAILEERTARREAAGTEGTHAEDRPAENPA